MKHDSISVKLNFQNRGLLLCYIYNYRTWAGIQPISLNLIRKVAGDEGARCQEGKLWFSINIFFRPFLHTACFKWIWGISERCLVKIKIKIFTVYRNSFVVRFHFSAKTKWYASDKNILKSHLLLFQNKSQTINLNGHYELHCHLIYNLSQKFLFNFICNSRNDLLKSQKDNTCIPYMIGLLL